jgi:SAM-dependent methyltransferase
LFFVKNLRENVNFLGGLLSQCGKPRGWFGRLLVRGMNLGHYHMTRWGLSKVVITDYANVLDVGCGGGRTLESLASSAKPGMAVGIDYSVDSVTVARKRIQQRTVGGRVEVLCGSVSSMPFPDATFDCVTAVESYYFWPDIAADLAEIRRVMKPDGQLVIIAGMYLGSKFDKRNMKVIRVGGMRCFSVQEFEDNLQDAGFLDVTVTVEPRKGWIVVVSVSGPNSKTKECAKRDMARPHTHCSGQPGARRV